jgi:uncharacterized DUF497 family protein
MQSSSTRSKKQFFLRGRHVTLFLRLDQSNIAHIAAHNVLPSEAEDVVFSDSIDLEMQVIDGEERFPQLGATRTGRILIVVTTFRGELTRVVTAYPASNAYQRFYFAQRGTGNGKANRP